MSRRRTHKFECVRCKHVGRWDPSEVHRMCKRCSAKMCGIKVVFVHPGDKLAEAVFPECQTCYATTGLEIRQFPDGTHLRLCEVCWSRWNPLPISNADQ